MGKITKTGKIKKEKEAREITIKSLIHRICTPTTAEKRLKSIESFFKTHSTDEFNHEELMHVWKGLFYAIWYSEMEKGCEEIMALIVDKSRNKPEMIICAFETLVIEWFGIDSIRLDKFMYFARQMTHPLLEIISKDPKSKIMLTVIQSIERCLGLILHVCDIIVDELFKIDQSTELIFIMSCIKPFVDLIERSDEDLSKHVVKEVLMTTLEKLEEIDSPKILIGFKNSVCKHLNMLLNNSSLKRLKRELIEKTKDVFVLDEEEVKELKNKRRLPPQVERNGVVYKRSRIPIAV